MSTSLHSTFPFNMYSVFPEWACDCSVQYLLIWWFFSCLCIAAIFSWKVFHTESYIHFQTMKLLTSMPHAEEKNIPTERAFKLGNLTQFLASVVGHLCLLLPDRFLHHCSSVHVVIISKNGINNFMLLWPIYYKF